MKPAFSVLFFTVTSGFGYGALICLLLMQTLDSQAMPSQDLLLSLLVALAFATIGLLSSTLHLANPKNAWRAFNRFRTSWLSREGVFAVVFYPLILAYMAMIYFPEFNSPWLFNFLTFLCVLVSLAVIISTGMIYASLKPIRQWHHPLVVPIYILLALSSGALLVLCLQAVLMVEYSELLANVFLVICATSLLFKLLYFISIGQPTGVSISSATGFSQAKVNLLDSGHSSGTFLTDEFVFQASAKKISMLRIVSVVMAFLLPFALLFFVPSKLSVITAFMLTYLGLLTERWLFFAEARHTVRLYHGDQTT